MSITAVYLSELYASRSRSTCSSRRFSASSFRRSASSSNAVFSKS